MINICRNLIIFVNTISLLLQFFFTQQKHFATSQSPYATKPIISFCISGIYTCAVFDTYKMKCAGSGGAFGQSQDYGGSLSTIGDNLPYFNAGTNVNIIQVTCQNFSVCFLTSSGGVKCAGNNDYGQTGIGTTDHPISESTGYSGDTLPFANLGTGLTASSVTGGPGRACILTTTGKVKCFGMNDHGELGLGDDTSRGTLSSDVGDNLPFVDFGTNVEIASIHAGPLASHTCVILSKPAANAQLAKCWGLNDQYQLGYGDRNNRGDESGEMGDSLPLVDLGTESRVKQLALGFRHTCALLINNKVKCFGVGSSGELGSGSTSTIPSIGDSLPSVLIDSGKTVKQVTVGQSRTCILYDDMLSMKCVGSNLYGQLGQGDTTTRGNTPSSMIPNITVIDLGTGTLKISFISSGSNSNCVIFEDFSVKCFGRNLNGQFAIGLVTSYIGDGAYEMGQNLSSSILFSPTTSPTKNPTRSPTFSPSNSPSTSPTKKPTLTPTTSIPTKNPTKSPTTSPSKTPTSSPTEYPTSSPFSYNSQDSAAYAQQTSTAVIASVIPSFLVGAVVGSLAVIVWMQRNQIKHAQMNNRNDIIAKQEP